MFLGHSLMSQLTAVKSKRYRAKSAWRWYAQVNHSPGADGGLTRDKDVYQAPKSLGWAGAGSTL